MNNNKLKPDNLMQKNIKSLFKFRGKRRKNNNAKKRQLVYNFMY